MGSHIGVEDDEEVYEFIYDSGHACARCQRKIMLVEEVYLLWVVAARVNGGVNILPVESDEGDLLYPPQYFCFDCWEENCEGLTDYVDKIQPVYDDKGVFECSICDSAILIDESFGQPILGEFRCSVRQPDEEAAYYFHRLQERELCICIACLKILNDEVIEMWEEGVDQEGECDQGTHLRCWRVGCSQQCDLVE